MPAPSSNLVRRICDPLTGEDKIPIHALCAALQEVQAGAITLGQLSTFLNLSAAEQQDGLKIVNKLTAAAYTLNQMKNWLLLGEAKGYTVSVVETKLQL